MEYKSTVIAFMLLSVVACGSGRLPQATPEPALITAQGLVFTGKSDSSEIKIMFMDNDLNKVVSGNPYGNQSGLNNNQVTSFYTGFAEVSLTGFHYFSDAVDMTCYGDDPLNKLDVILRGSVPGGVVGIYEPCIDGSFYFLGNNGQYSLQGPQDEMTEFEIVGGTPTPTDLTYSFLCKGNDDHNYTMTFHSNFEPLGLNVPGLFHVKAATFEGVISIKREGSNVQPLDVFFNK